MKRKAITVICLLLAVSLFLWASAFAADYEAMKGVKSARAFFDFRIGDASSAMAHMSLIHQTYKELAEMKKKPAFVVVFIGPSVKLVSKDREGFSPQDRKTLDDLAGTISAMSKDGIKFEICLAAAKAFNVNAGSVLPEIRKVPNGWISEIGYQAQGYSLVPAY